MVPKSKGKIKKIARIRIGTDTVSFLANVVPTPIWGYTSFLNGGPTTPRISWTFSKHFLINANANFQYKRANLSFYDFTVIVKILEHPPILDHFGPFWTILDHCGPLWAILEQFRPILGPTKNDYSFCVKNLLSYSVLRNNK